MSYGLCCYLLSFCPICSPHVTGESQPDRVTPRAKPLNDSHCIQNAVFPDKTRLDQGRADHHSHLSAIFTPITLRNPTASTPQDTRTAPRTLAVCRHLWCCGHAVQIALPTSLPGPLVPAHSSGWAWMSFPTTNCPDLSVHPLPTYVLYRNNCLNSWPPHAHEVRTGNVLCGHAMGHN